MTAGPRTLFSSVRVVERHFRAMNTDVHVVLVVEGAEESGTEMLDRAEASIRDREARWSRFLPNSELSVLNRAAGRPVVVSPDTFALVAKAIEAWHLTNGAFDPTIGSCLVVAGYDRSFELLDAPSRTSGEDPVQPAPTPEGIELHWTSRAIVLPPDIMLDLGGIAKGETAEAVTAELRASGVVGCCVNIGGDVRVDGEAPTSDGWTVLLDLPGSDQCRTVALASGAVCTSTIVKRRWLSKTGQEHHIRNPSTGRSLETGVVSVSVIAARADQAEVLAKAAIAAGPAGAPGVLETHGATGVVVHADGAVVEVSGFDAYGLPIDPIPVAPERSLIP